MIDSVLIANRGEIACRIIRACRRLGVRSIAVYSDADRHAPHVRQADEAHHLGGARPGESYLNMDRLLEVAASASADAVHPGYGFLAENADFARRCAEAGLVFIGPSPETIDRMGSKAEAKALMEAAGVPTVPGYHGEDQDADQLAGEAERIGFPLMIKAAAGGGGKGMRIVREAKDFTSALEGAQREAENAFGDRRVILERYIQEPRHIEVQVFGDGEGNVVHLFERDCSSQRRYQKIIEEAPAPGLAEDQRQALLEAGVAAAKAVDYVNAGTVEFIVDRSGEFFFMEMNTRLQVEHPVTEAVTGLDLVEWQLRVASGEALPLAQEAIRCEGHAMEARIYAEDPAAGFLPSSGPIHWLHFAENARIDTGVESGGEVTIHYDPMIAKLIVQGQDRHETTARLRQALEHTAVAGPKTNLDFLLALASHERFIEGRMHTAFLDAELETVYPAIATPPDEVLVAATVLQLLHEEAQYRERQGKGPEPHSPWALADGWRLGHWGRRVVSLLWAGEHHRLDAVGHDGAYAIALGDRNFTIADAELTPGKITLVMEGVRRGITVLQNASTIQLAWRGRLYALLAEDPFAVDAGVDAAADAIIAPMPGRIVAIKAAAGDTVSEGQEVLVMEAMKMELTLSAPRDGVIASLDHDEGDFVEADTILVELESDGD